MKLFGLGLLALLIGGTAWAGEEGYILNGERHLVFKDGKKVGPTVAEYVKEKDRSPAALLNKTGSTDYYLYFITDSTTGATCYLDVDTADARKIARVLHCVK